MTSKQHIDQAIREALDVPDWDQSINRVKEAVANAFRRVDRRVQIQNTGYFNHSFVPDFQLSWGGRAQTRDVYLRLDAGPSFLSNDLNFLKAGHPILFGLNVSEPDPRRTSDLDSKATEAQTLITDSAGVEALAEKPNTEFSGVVPSAVLRGGKGRVMQPQADALVSAGVKFFEAARRHEPETVTASVSTLDNHIGQPEMESVNNFGRIVWEATGGKPHTFPIETNLSGLDDDAIRFLMEEGPSEDLAYWRLIGKSVNLDRLFELGLERPKNLRNILAANLDRMYARVLEVHPKQQSLDRAPQWAIRRSALELRGDDFVAYFASRLEDIPNRPENGEGKKPRGIPIQSLQERTKNLDVESVSISTIDGKKVTVESKAKIAVQKDRTLAAHVQSLVESVGLLVGGKHLLCRFDELRASGHTNAQFELRELLSIALPVLWDLQESDSDEINTAIDLWHGVVRSEPSEGKLFNDGDV